MLYIYGTVAVLMVVSSEAVNSALKNIFFLGSDDMRAELGVFSGPDFPWVHPRMRTPHLDKLAGSSLLLRRAYVQQAVCNPSRASMLTSRRPDTTRVFDLTNYWRIVGGNYTTLPQYFKENGYITAGMGKVFHPGAPSGFDDPVSWNMPYFHDNMTYWGPHQSASWMSVDKSTYEANPLPDQQIANKAVEMLQTLAPKARTGEKPFFLAVGFHRPHLPFVCPSEFFQLYPLDTIQLPNNPYAPVDMPEIAWSDFDELRMLTDIKTKYGHGSINTTLPDFLVLNLRRAYYACVSYVDSLVGTVLTELESLGLASNTVVMFWGDHGWQLGEHGEWCKHTNFELATHAPLMLKIPGQTHTGVVTDNLVELVDVFPTLVEAAGLKPIPLCPEQPFGVTTCTEGVSFFPLVKDPRMPWKSAVFSQYPRMAVDGDHVMGYSMRTGRYRLTSWLMTSGAPLYHVSWNWSFHWISVELYDYQNDPEGNVNRAFDPVYKDLVETLHKQLVAGWRHSLPPHLLS